MNSEFVNSEEIDLDNLTAEAHVSQGDDDAAGEPMTPQEVFLRELEMAESNLERIESSADEGSATYTKLFKSRELNKLRNTVKEARQYAKLAGAIKTERQIQTALAAMKSAQR
jgi:hypothetical protein